MLLQKAGIPSFSWLNIIIFHFVWNHIFIHSSINRYLGCFHIFDILSNITWECRYLFEILILFSWGICLFIVVMVSFAVVGLHPADLQALCMPSFKNEERARSQQLRHQWFNGWGILHVWSKVVEWHPTVCSAWWAGHGVSLRSGGTGRLPVTGELMSGRLIGYHGNQQRGMPLTAPLRRTVTNWGLGQAHREVSHVSRCRWSRHWSGRGWTENKRTATLNGLTIHLCRSLLVWCSPTCLFLLLLPLPI